MYSFKCGQYSFATKRSDNLRRHLKNFHGIDKSKAVSTKSTFVSSHSGYGITRYQPMTESENGSYTLDGIKTFDEEFESNKSHNSDCVLNVIPNHLTLNCMDPSWKHPFTAIVAGPTGCGKTVFTLKFITLASGTPVPEKIIWCFGVYQDEFNKYPDIDFREGLPDPNTFDGTTKTLLVIDDLMSETDESVTKIFTKISHHRSVSVLYLSQNLFFGGKQNGTISLNTHYMVLFRNPRDASQISVLGKQMYPNKSKILVEAFRDAKFSPYGYLLIDLRPELEDKFRLRTGIFPGDTHYVYAPK